MDEKSKQQSQQFARDDILQEETNRLPTTQKMLEAGIQCFNRLVDGVGRVDEAVQSRGHFEDSSTYRAYQTDDRCWIHDLSKVL